MTRTMNVTLFLAGVGLVGVLPSDSSASGWLRRCDSGCESAPCAPPAPPPAPKYEERKVTRYRPVIKEKEVEVCVMRVVEKEVKRTVMVPVVTKEKRNVTECVPTFKDVEHKYVEMVPRLVKEKVKQTIMERHTKEIEEVVPVCRIVRKTVTDDCGRCSTVCERVTENVKVKRCVVECVPVVREVEVCRTVCDRVEKVGVRKVCEMQRVEKVVEVSVVHCEPQERLFKRFECVPGTEKRRIQYCEMEAYEDTIRVCVSGCDTGCSQRRCFGHRCGGCN